MPREIKACDKFNQIKLRKKSLKDDLISLEFSTSFKKRIFTDTIFIKRGKIINSLGGKLSENAEILQTKQRFSISTNKANEMGFSFFLEFQANRRT